MIFDEERPQKPRAHVIGEDLAKLSVAELEDRILLLQAEAARLSEAIAAKKAGLSAAQSFFKR